nr:MAG TPA: hypothetical protein [Bacteriophage sp.]
MFARGPEEMFFTAHARTAENFKVYFLVYTACL